MRDRRRMSVVFEADAVVLANGQRRERLEGVQDTASQFIQMTYVFSTQPERLRVGGAVAFPLALPRTMDTWVYEVVEAQTLKTPFGPLAAFHLKPRPRPTRRNELTVELWIAPELRYLPVRIRIEQDAATFVDLMISGKPEMAAPAAGLHRPNRKASRHDDLRMHPHRRARRRRAPRRRDHAEPAEAAQRAQRHADGRARRRAARRSTPTTRSAASSSPAARRRSPPAPTSRRWRPTASPTPTRRA